MPATGRNVRVRKLFCPECVSFFAQPTSNRNRRCWIWAKEGNIHGHKTRRALLLSSCRYPSSIRHSRGWSPQSHTWKGDMNMNAGKVAMVVSFVAVMAVSVLAAGKSSAAQGDVTTAVAGQKTVVHHGTWISFETSSAECSVCHAQLYAQWRLAAGSDLKTVGQGTNHAISSTEPV